MSERSPAAVARNAADTERRLDELRSIDRAALPGADAVSYDTVLFTTEVRNEGDRSFNYGGGGSGEPYVLSQLSGSYREVPDFLDTKHRIETAEDAEAYLARLSSGCRRRIDQECGNRRGSMPVLVWSAPDFVLDRTLAQLHDLGDDAGRQIRPGPVPGPAHAGQENRRRLGEMGHPSLRGTSVKKKPALQREIALATAQRRAHASHDAGVWRLPDGEDYYRASVRQWYHHSDKSGRRDPSDRGLDLVAKLSAEADALMKSEENNCGGEVGGRRIAAMYDDATPH